MQIIIRVEGSADSAPTASLICKVSCRGFFILNGNLKTLFGSMACIAFVYNSRGKTSGT